MKFIDSRKDKVFVSLLLIALGLIFFPIINSGFLQYDDVGRNLYAYYGWQGDGRALSDLIMKLMVGPGGLVNAGYFFQLLALFCASLACYILMLGFKLQTGKKSFVSVIILFCTPNILENISFVYDSFPMFLAILLAVVAFYCCVQGGIIHTIAASLAIFLSLNLYQVGINVFYVLCFVMLSYESLQKEKAYISLGKIIAVSFFPLFFYKLCVLLIYRLGDYAGHKSNMTSISELCPNVLRIFFEFLNKATVLFGFNPAYCLFVCLIISMPLLIIVSNKTDIFSKLKSFFYYIISVVSVPGMLLLLTDPLIAARTLIPVGALLSACMCFVLKSNVKVYQYVAILCGAGAILFFSLFAHSLGSYQKRLQHGVEIKYPQIAMLLNDISTKGDTLYVVGEPDIPQAPFYNARYRNAILNISYQPLASGSPWGLVSMVQYGFNNQAEYKVYTDFYNVVSNMKMANKILERKDLKITVFKKDNNLFVCFSNICSL